jgi:hypothetical protein
MTNQTQQLHDLLSFLIREANAHGLPEIRISLPRARTMLADLKVTPAKPAQEKTPAYYKKLDKAFGF